jgi:hypothetical protein
MTTIRQMWDNTAHHRSWWVAGGISALLVVAVFLFGLVNMIGAGIRWVTSDSNQPDLLTQVDRHTNDAGLVSLFARHCTELWAKSTPETLDSLRECVTVPAKARNASSMPAEVSGIDVYPPQLTYKDANVGMWAVLVAANIKEFTADTATRQFIWWSVSLPKNGGPRGVVLPGVRATGLPAGVDMELSYNHEVRGGAPDGQAQPQPTQLYDVVRGFITAYLCGPAKDVDTYVSADSGLATLGQLYGAVTINGMQSDVPADGPPQPGQQVHVLVTVTGKEAKGGQKAMQYPLLVVESGGRWAVAALEDLPAITGRTLPPGG